MKFYNFFLIFIICGSVILNACKKKNNDDSVNTETINIGFIVPMGLYPEWSQEMINGASGKIDFDENGDVTT